MYYLQQPAKSLCGYESCSALHSTNPIYEAPEVGNAEVENRKLYQLLEIYKSVKWISYRTCKRTDVVEYCIPIMATYSYWGKV